MSVAKTVGVWEGVGVGLGLIGSGLLYLYPNKRWMGWGFILVGLLFIFTVSLIAVTRHLVLKQAAQASVLPLSQQLIQTANPHNEFKPTNEFSPKIEIHHQSQAPTLAAPAPKPFAQPHIEFTNPALGLYSVDAFNHLQQVDFDPSVTVMLARFYYKPERNVPPYMNVKAHISIADAQGRPMKARFDGLWDGHYDSATIRFGTAETYRLVVALLPPPHVNECDSIVTWGFGARSDGLAISGFAPDKHVLIAGEFRLTIELVGKHQHDVVLHTSLNFRLNVRQQSMELI